MKHTLFSLLLFTIFCFFSFLPAQAQDEKSKGQLLFVHEDLVIPSMVGQYEKAAKGVVALFKEHNLTSTFTGASAMDFTYFYFTPVKDYSGAAFFESAFGELQKKAGADVFQAAMKKFDGTYNTHRNFMLRYQEQLSHNPEYGRDISAGLNFRHWDFYYIHPGKEEAAKNIAQEWKALYEKNNINEGFRLYMGDIGTDFPLFLVAQSGKDAIDIQKRSMENMKSFGNEGQALMQKTWTVIRRFERKSGFIRPDLSHMPGEGMALK